MSALSFAARSLTRQPGRAILGIVGIAATGALLLDMLLLSRGLVVSMQGLLENLGFDVRVMATQSIPLTGPRLTNVGATTAAIAALPDVDEVVPLRVGVAEVDIGRRRASLTLMGANVARRRPWTLVSGQELAATGGDKPVLLVNRNMADALHLTPGGEVTLRGQCLAGSSMPPVRFRVGGVADFPFDQKVELTAVTNLRDFDLTCGGEHGDEADMLMVASRPAYGPDRAAQSIRRIRPDLHPITNEELVTRFQQVEFSYFRQISFVLSSITMFFAFLLITVLLSVSTNQRFGEIAALRALGFSQSRMVADVLWRSALLVGAGGALAVPLGLALAKWLDTILRAMPGIPSNLHFFVLEPRALVLHAAFLVVTATLAAIYPMLMVSRLPIAATLRNEVVS